MKRDQRVPLVAHGHDDREHGNDRSHRPDCPAGARLRSAHPRRSLRWPRCASADSRVGLLARARGTGGTSCPGPRPDALRSKSRRNPTQPGFEALLENRAYGSGTHPSKPAALNGDQFFMLGDNSQASLDSRLWGNPHPLVAEQVDPAPFVVNRSLIIGKAWVVYFPAPYHVGDKGMAVVPDFGRLRFIR